MDRTLPTGRHIGLVRCSLALILLGIAGPRTIQGTGAVLNGLRAALTSARLESFGYFGSVVSEAGQSLALSYRNWCFWYVPPIAATFFALLLLRRRTPRWLRVPLGFSA